MEAPPKMTLAATHFSFSFSFIPNGKIGCRRTRPMAGGAGADRRNSDRNADRDRGCNRGTYHQPRTPNSPESLIFQGIGRSAYLRRSFIQRSSACFWEQNQQNRKNRPKTPFGISQPFRCVTNPRNRAGRGVGKTRIRETAKPESRLDRIEALVRTSQRPKGRHSFLGYPATHPNTLFAYLLGGPAKRRILTRTRIPVPFS
jgi:hypothetical protein